MSRNARAATRSHGFTLIEVLAVMFLTALVLGVALNFYVDLSNQSLHASEATREVRRAASLLDRMARDLQGAILEKKPADRDPLAHPWIFAAESRLLLGGADRVLFIARRPSDYHGEKATPDLVMVSYALRHSEFGEDYELVRWSQPYVPADFDPEFPPVDDPEALLLATGLTHFGLHFQADSGEWQETWDSSQLLESSALPVAVEIEVALAPFDPEALAEDLAGYRRRVLLPVRPLDFQTLLDPVAYAQSGGAESEEECTLTVADCIDASKLTAAASAKQEGPVDLSALLELSKEDRQAIRALAQGDITTMCWSHFKESYANFPGVKPECR